MTDTTTLLQSLVQRIELLEDKLAIQELITAYGPAVDAGEAEKVGALWAEDAVYDVENYYMDGRDEIMAMVRGQAHQSLIHAGCGHVLDPINIVVDGDRAVATCHSQLLRRNENEDSFRVWRVTANRFELAKTDGEWKIARRTSRVLDGRAEARALLARAGS